jgi:hypothetical protein
MAEMRNTYRILIKNFKGGDFLGNLDEGGRTREKRS